MLRGQSERGVQIGHRAGEYGSKGALTVVACTQLNVSACCIRRLRALCVNETAERVGAVAHTLRPAQHLDVIDIEQCRSAAQAAEIDVINEQTYGRIGRALILFELTDAPAKISSLIETMRPLGLSDVSRTGVAAISRDA